MFVRWNEREKREGRREAGILFLFFLASSLSSLSPSLPLAPAFLLLFPLPLVTRSLSFSFPGGKMKLTANRTEGERKGQQQRQERGREGRRMKKSKDEAKNACIIYIVVASRESTGTEKGILPHSSLSACTHTLLLASLPRLPSLHLLPNCFFSLLCCSCSPNESRGVTRWGSSHSLAGGFRP